MIQGQWRIFHLFRSSLISSDIFHFSLYGSCTSFINQVFKFFFDVIIDEIVFLISFLDFSLLGYRNTTDFYILQFCCPLPNYLCISLYSQSSPFLCKSHIVFHGVEELWFIQQASIDGQCGHVSLFTSTDCSAGLFGPLIHSGDVCPVPTLHFFF